MCTSELHLFVSFSLWCCKTSWRLCTVYTNKNKLKRYRKSEFFKEYKDWNMLNLLACQNMKILLLLAVNHLSRKNLLNTIKSLIFPMQSWTQRCNVTKLKKNYIYGATGNITLAILNNVIWPLIKKKLAFWCALWTPFSLKALKIFSSKYTCTLYIVQYV